MSKITATELKNILKYDGDLEDFGVRKFTPERPGSRSAHYSNESCIRIVKRSSSSNQLCIINIKAEDEILSNIEQSGMTAELYDYDDGKGIIIRVAKHNYKAKRITCRPTKNFISIETPAHPMFPSLRIPFNKIRNESDDKDEIYYGYEISPVITKIGNKGYGIAFFIPEKLKKRLG